MSNKIKSNQTHYHRKKHHTRHNCPAPESGLIHMNNYKKRSSPCNDDNKIKFEIVRDTDP